MQTSAASSQNHGTVFPTDFARRILHFPKEASDEHSAQEHTEHRLCRPRTHRLCRRCPPSAVQIETIAAAEALWRDDALAGQTDRQDGTAFDPARTRVAVTDLDSNGRLELLFCHGMWGAESMSTLPEYLQNMPTALGMSAYEIAEDGSLVRLPDAECSGSTPNLTTLDSFHPMVKDGIRRYNLRTEQLHIDADGKMRCSERYQRVTLKDSTLTCELLAESWSLVRLDPPTTAGRSGCPRRSTTATLRTAICPVRTFPRRALSWTSIEITGCPPASAG